MFNVNILEKLYIIIQRKLYTLRPDRGDIRVPILYSSSRRFFLPRHGSIWAEKKRNYYSSWEIKNFSNTVSSLNLKY
jgi:hypothetical protein